MASIFDILNSKDPAALDQLKASFSQNSSEMPTQDNQNSTMDQSAAPSSKFSMEGLLAHVNNTVNGSPAKSEQSSQPSEAPKEIDPVAARIKRIASYDWRPDLQNESLPEETKMENAQNFVLKEMKDAEESKKAAANSRYQNLLDQYKRLKQKQSQDLAYNDQAKNRGLPIRNINEPEMPLSPAEQAAKEEERKQIKGEGPLADTSKYESTVNQEKTKMNFDDAFNKGFDALLNSESGNRQTDENGNPITSPKGAIGAAQIMPSTAPEAAALAGLPWDEQKYKTDADYNKALGKAYFRKQLEDAHGDFSQAYAAYNAGPGALRKAKAQAIADGSPESWLTYLPDETKNYVQKNMLAFGGDNLTPKGIGPVSDPKQYASMLDNDKQDQDEVRNVIASKAENTNRKPAVIEESKDESNNPLTNAQRGFSNNTVDALKQVQNQQNNNHQYAKMVDGLNLLGTSIAGLGSNAVLKNTLHDYYTDEAKDDHLTKDFAAQVEKEKDDSGSDASIKMQKFSKEILQKAGFSPGLVEGMSYNEIEKNFPQITKMMDVKMTTDARKDAMKMHNDQMVSNRDERNNFKLSQSDTKRLDTLGHMLNPQNASSRNGLGKDVASYNTIQNVKALFNGEADLNNLDNRQVTEIARVLDRILSGGSPTISGTEHLTPESARQLIAKKLEFITSKRHGAGAGSFIESMKHTFNREEDIIKKRISESAKNDAGQYLDIADRNPEAWDNMMAQKNLLDVLGSDTIKKQQSLGKKNRSEFEKSNSDKQSNSENNSFPRILINAKTGQQATVANASELKEANSEGFQ